MESIILYSKSVQNLIDNGARASKKKARVRFFFKAICLSAEINQYML